MGANWQAARYHENRDRGKSWSVLPGYAIGGYLPCTAFKQGCYNTEDFTETHLFLSAY